MKKLMMIIAGFVLLGTSAYASGNNYSTYYRGYGNSFIFVEQGIEFAVFPDGQFDFNVNNYGPNFSAHANLGSVNISFNTGYSYDAYVQYDDFGAVIQIENVPIYYDYYGRISRAGDVYIRYNNRGYVSRVGGLYVHYNRYNRFSHYTGYINIYNRRYVYRPWHVFYRVPLIDLCIINPRPYRRYYEPIRYRYYRPYRDNYRPRVNYNYSRRGDRAYAKRQARVSDRYRQDVKGRRSVAQNSRNTRDIGRNNNSLARPDNNTVQRRNNGNRSSERMNARHNTRESRPQMAQRQENVRNRGNSDARPQVNKNREIRRDQPKLKSRPKARTSDSRRMVSRDNTRKPNISQRSKQSKPKVNQSRSSERLRHKSRANSSRPQARNSRRSH